MKIPKSQIELLLERQRDTSASIAGDSHGGVSDEEKENIEGCPAAIAGGLLYDFIPNADQPTISTGFSPDALSALAAQMVQRRPGTAFTTPAGYTYFAQFITHDIVGSTTLCNPRNPGTAELNLDSIYFDFSDSEFETLIDKFGRFRLGRSKGDQDISDSDLPRRKIYREKDGITKAYHVALVPEHRNDGNSILSQFHLLWLRFHNIIVDQGLKATTTVDKKESYTFARNLVTLVFQRLVVEDFLKKMCHPAVYEYYSERDFKLHFYSGYFSSFQTNGREFRLPIEFNNVVSRLFHTMVRDRYKLHNQDTRTLLNKILNKNNQVKEDKLVNWNLFFGADAFNIAAAIEPKYQLPLRELDEESLAVLSKAEIEAYERARKESTEAIRDLVKMDLEASKSLLSGRSFLDAMIKAAKIHQGVKSPLEIAGIMKPTAYFRWIERAYLHLLEASGLNSSEHPFDEIPLLLFLLIESQLYPLTDSLSSDYPEQSHIVQFLRFQASDLGKLGPTSSVLLIESLLTAIKASPINFFLDEEQVNNELGPLASVYQDILRQFRPLRIKDLINEFKLSAIS